MQDQLKNVQQIQASEAAFAAIRGDGSVVTWGDATRGGNSSAMQDQLKRSKPAGVLSRHSWRWFCRDPGPSWLWW